MRNFAVLIVAALALAACHPKPSAKAEASQAQAFLAKNATKAGVHVLPDGLQYEVVSSGPATGERPKLGDEVKVNYEGKLVDGTVFDSTYERGEPAAMPLKHLIPAWEEALPMMRPGDTWMLYVPPKLGYGDKGAGGVIPPNAALIFKIELIDFLPAPGRVGAG
jgi:peptidylprolyl isomerase/FKBP-type peptidyl-prolyl cis-trans isomerase FklB